MSYPDFKNTLTSLVSNFLGELDDVYENDALTLNEKIDSFKLISAKFCFPIDDVIASMQ